MQKNEVGGLSGQPLKDISTDLIKKFYKETKGEVKIKSSSTTDIADDFRTLKIIFEKSHPELDLKIETKDRKLISDMANNIQAENKTMPRQQALVEAITKIGGKQRVNEVLGRDNLHIDISKAYTGETSIAPGKGEWGIKRKSQG